MILTYPKADREGNAYRHIRYVDRNGNLMAVQVESPARQAKKATGLRGRRWVRFRKTSRRRAAA